jgi:hypothetical protein
MCQIGNDTKRSACCYHSKYIEPTYPEKCSRFTPSLRCRKVLALEALPGVLYALFDGVLGATSLDDDTVGALRAIADRMPSK